jgi:hypothetical protein
MSDKFFKFHYKNDEKSLVASYDVVLDDFSDAMKFAYDKLDELNQSVSGYRIVGVYEILYPTDSYKPNQIN